MFDIGGDVGSPFGGEIRGRVSPGAIKAAADAACRKPLEEVADDDPARSCRWGFYDNGTNFFLQADLPCEQGAVVVKALEREAATMVRTPEDDPVTWRDAARADGHVIGIGRTSIVVPRWLRRQLLHLIHRDHGCTFPGCGTRRLVDAHRMLPGMPGAPTNLDNLIMLCRFHHRLVHEHRWKVFLGDIPGTARWLRPDGRPFEPGRAPPVEACAA